jgi:exodeoxyribonuclease V
MSIMQLSLSQQNALDQIASWLEAAPKTDYCDKPACLDRDDDEDGIPHTHGSAQDYPVFAVGGLAGTGKSLLAAQLAPNLDKRVTFGAPTNKAAKVLRDKLPQDQQNRAGTYHSLLYRPNPWHSCLKSGGRARELACRCGFGFAADECECPRFRCETCENGEKMPGCRVESHLDFEPRQYAGGFRDVLVLDEASMITEEQVLDIKRFGLPVLLIGDHGQLPPVKGMLSPWMRKPDVILEENFRQTEESGIIALALAARGGSAAAGRYGTSALVTSGSEHPTAWQALSPSRLVPGPDSAVITWTNQARAAINAKIHEAMNPDAPLGPGERVISLGTYDCEVIKKSPYGWRATGWQERVHNGFSGTIVDILGITRKTVDVVLELDQNGEKSPPLRVTRRLDRGQLGAEKVLRPDERVAAAFDYAYCLTCHKAQGSEFRDVAVIGTGPPGPGKKRWLYTAVTRARDRVLVIT